MASLINDKETVRRFVKINFINDTSSLPDFALAAERHLIPIIGQDMYDELLDQVTDFDFPAEGEDPVEIEDEELVEKCRAVIAPLAYMDQLAVIQAQITDSGIKTTNTENLQAAHRWEYNEVKDHLVDKGSFATDSLLKFLFANKDDYEPWTDSQEYKDANSLVIKTGEEFNKYFSVSQPYRVWWDLRPVINEVQDLYIKSTIGDEFLDELNANDAPAVEEKAALVLIKKALTHFAIVKAIEKKSVKIGPEGFTTKVIGAYSESVGFDDAQAPDNQLSLLYNSCDNSANSYLIQLQEYLNEKATDELFATYKASKYYTAPTTTPAVSPNANRKIFGM
jgi:hypothetical protein